MAEENSIGRPTVMTPEVIAKLEEAFAIGCTDLEACFFADISKDSLYRYQQDHPEFCERKEQLKERPVLLARTTVVKEIQERGELALKFLERKKKDEFSLSQDLNLGGQNGNNPIKIDKIEIVHVKPDSEIKN